MPRKAKEREKLTQRLLDRLARVHHGTRYLVEDGGGPEAVPGFGARLTQSGWVYVVSYSANGKRHRNKKLGEAALFKTVEDAREAARRHIAKATLALLPIDPADGPRPATLGEIAEQYLAWSKQNTKIHDQIAYRMNRHLKPWFERPALSITRQDLVALKHRIGAEPCDRPDRCRYKDKCVGHRPQANAVLTLLSAIYSHAQSEEASIRLPAGFNPCRPLSGLHYPRPPKHDRSATKTELRQLREAIWKCRSWIFRACIWFIALTGLRKSEAMRLRWEHVNLGREEIVVNPGRQKIPGRCYFLPQTKGNRPAVLPLSKPAVELLLSIPKECEWVFPGRAVEGEPSRHRKDLNTTWDYYRVEAGADELHIHDWRHTLSTWAARAGVDYRVRQGLLNHAPPQDITDRVYTGAAQVEEMRPALEGHGKALLRAAGVKTGAALVWPESRNEKKVVDLASKRFLS